MEHLRLWALPLASPTMPLYYVSKPDILLYHKLMTCCFVMDLQLATFISVIYTIHSR